jgi:tRNA1Val (adenine37-N6)-methyltransferase
MKVGTDAVLLGCLTDCRDAMHCVTILEIGCGCGVISLMLAQRFPNIKITAIDTHKASVDEAFENFQNSIWKDRLSVKHQSLQEFSKTCSTKFDTIVSNPPFFSKSLQSPNTDRTNARHTTILTYDDLVLCSEKLLTSQGKLFVIVPTLELENFQKSIEQSDLCIHQILHVFGVDRKKSKRVILECGFENKLPIEKSYNYIDNYSELTKNCLLWGRFAYAPLTMLKWAFAIRPYVMTNKNQSILPVLAL